MGRRKETADSEEEDAFIVESEDETPKIKKPKPKISVKKPRLPSDDEEGGEEKERPLKKKKVEQPSSLKKAPKDVNLGALLVDSSRDKYIDLGKKRRATVRVFKGTALLDIREYYSAGDEEKPGKKGISLSAEQWEILKDNAEIIDTLFKTANK